MLKEPTSILFPTDFSPVAENALEFAVAVARAQSCKIILFHATSIHLAGVQMDESLISVDEMENIENEQLLAFKIKAEKKYPEVRFVSKSEIGFPIELIKEELKNGESCFVVMGTKGSQGMQDLFLGSQTAGVINHADCPVLAIPADARFTGYRKITLATNLEKDDIIALQQIITIFGKSNPEITLLHIENGSRRDPEAALVNWFHSEVLPHVQYEHLNTLCIEDNDVVKSLNAFLLENPTDVLVTSTRKRNFFERIFDRSITRQMVYHTHTPILALHVHQSKGQVVF